MTLEMTRAWILLSVSKTPSELSRIISVADSLNKAIPTRIELGDGLGWLRAAGLVERDGPRFNRTAAGSQLVADCERGCTGAFQVWDKVAGALDLLAQPNFAQESISDEDLAMAIKAHSKATTAMFSKFGAKDA
jgi:hypothetical protein